MMLTWTKQSNLFLQAFQFSIENAIFENWIIQAFCFGLTIQIIILRNKIKGINRNQENLNAIGKGDGILSCCQLPLCYIERDKRVEMELQPPLCILWFCAMPCIHTSAFPECHDNDWTAHRWQRSSFKLNVIYVLPEEKELCFMAK